VNETFGVSVEDAVSMGIGMGKGNARTTTAANNSGNGGREKQGLSKLPATYEIRHEDGVVLIRAPRLLVVFPVQV
jgi:hypothetical protein